MRKDAEIIIKSTRVGGDIKIEMVSKYKKPKGLTFQYYDFNMIFKIEANKFGLTFVDDLCEAFWVQKGSCPKQRKLESDFKPLDVSENGKRLDVFNANLSTCDYHFALNFDSLDGPIHYDPVILNKNSIPMHDPEEWSSSELLAVAAGVVGAVAALFGLKRLFDRRGRARH